MFHLHVWKPLVSVLMALMLAQWACTPSNDPVDLTAVASSDLTGIDLHEVNGYGVDLSHRTLIDADLSVSRFPDASFSHSDLTGANLTRSIVDRVDFRWAVMTGTTLDFACGLESASWTGTVLDAKWAIVIDVLAVNPTTDLSNLDLTNVCFSTRPYSSHNFSYSNLENAVFSMFASELTCADFTGANLRNARFGQAGLQGAIFVNADLTNSELSSSDLRGADFTNAILDGAWLSHANIEGVNFSPDQISSMNIQEGVVSNISKRTLWPHCEK